MSTNNNNNTPEPTDADLERQFSEYDPVFDAPSPSQVVGDVRLPEPTLSGLPPAMRQEIEAKLVNVPFNTREATTKQLIAEALYANSRSHRARAGLGEGATETQRADVSIANEVRELSEEADRIRAQLDEVRMVQDPETGNMIPTADPLLKGERRAGLEARLGEIGHHYTLLIGIEGEKRRADAIKRDIETHHARQEQIARMKEADELAEKLARDEEIQRLAKSKARFKQSFLG